MSPNKSRNLDPSSGEYAAPAAACPGTLDTTFRDLADAMPVLVWITRPDGSYEYYNRRWIDYTGSSDEHIHNDSWQRFLHPDDVAHCAACWAASLSSGEPYETEYRFRRAADGEYRWHLARSLPTHDADGRIARWFGTCTDIHDRKQAEEALQQAGRAKDEFLSIVSHELRTPLSAILGWTQLLEMDVLDAAERKEAIETIKQQAKAQSQLIEDLLDVSRILNGKFHMRAMDVSLARVLAAAVNAVTPIAAQGDVKLIQSEWNPALIVHGDPHRLQQVVTNLLTNAIKFTPKDGTVQIGLEMDNSSARVIVHDSGMGIPVDQIEAIFERFKQVGGEAIRDKGGLGLGLSIVKHVVDAHHGSVCAKSEGPGQGSRFEMVLPLSAVSEAADTVPGSTADHLADVEPLTGISILVVDDEESARTVIAATLRKAGAGVLTARSAADAWGLLGTKPFDVLISDVAMPGEDGLQFIDRVRHSDQPFRQLPALALTGFASVDDQTRALAAGFQMHAAKPVEPADLTRRVASIVRASKQNT